MLTLRVSWQNLFRKILISIDGRYTFQYLHSLVTLFIVHGRVLNWLLDVNRSHFIFGPTLPSLIELQWLAERAVASTEGPGLKRISADCSEAVWKCPPAFIR